MSIAAANANAVDPWGQSSETSLASGAHRRIPPQHIPDDWDDEDDDLDNEKIWESANTKSPMPELVISRSSAGPSVVTPPVIAIQAPLRILKRPSANSTSTSTSSSLTNASASADTFAEREAKYQVARERIFGEAQASETNNSSASPKLRSTPPPAATTVVRNPRGPSVEPEDGQTNGASRGFGGKRGRRSSKANRGLK